MVVGIGAVAQHSGDQRGDERHLRLLHPLRGDRRRADAHAAGDERAARVVGDGVLVQRDAGLVEHRLGLLAGEVGVERAQVDHHQVAVGAAADEPEALVAPSASASALGVEHDLLRVLGEARLQRLVEGDRLAGDHVLERAALPTGEHRLVDRRGVLRRRQDASAAWAAQRLVRGERDDVGVRHRVGMRTAGDQSGEVRRVEQEVARRPRRRWP